MSEEQFPLITEADTKNNKNSQYGLDIDVQMMLANTNTQFALEITR